MPLAIADFFMIVLTSIRKKNIQEDEYNLIEKVNMMGKRTQAITRKVLSLEEEVVELKKNNKVTKDLVGNKVQNSTKTEDTIEGDGTSARVHNQNNDSLKKDNPKESKEKKVQTEK